jgi:Leucine Rich repeat
LDLSPHPSDGSLNVLRDFFARSDTTLTKVTLHQCNFGSQQDAEQLLAAFHTNRTVVDLSIRFRVANLQGAALGNFVSAILQNMPQLQRLSCHGCSLGAEGARGFQSALQANPTLRELDLSFCEIGNVGFRLIADALVGNTTMDKLDIKGNNVTHVGLDDVTRLIESTHLKTIDFALWYDRVFDVGGATQRFVTTLQQQKASVQELQDIRVIGHLPLALAIVKNSLTRNRQLNRVSSLLSP